MNINFISNLELKYSSGGWGGINWNIYQELKGYADLKYVGPINPDMDFWEKLGSKLKRTAGLKGNFSFFSNKRLDAIKDLVMPQIQDGDYNLFFGQTPWIACKPNTDYGVYLDADFMTYLRIFSQPDQFSKRDIARIAKQEERWLQGAKDIFVGSEWAWQEMLKSYNLNEAQKVVVHTGGNIDMPEQDSYANSKNLLFISLNFEKKGGHVCVDAYKLLKEKYPDLTLTIIGQEPPQEILAIEGISYAGLLRKTESDELQTFRNLLSKAFLLIHPTKMDTMGAVLIEAGYFGCPSIAPRRFGIPELVIHNETGFIIDLPFQASDFADKIEVLLNDKDMYHRFRKRAWDYTRNELSWAGIGEKIYHTISK